MHARGGAATEDRQLIGQSLGVFSVVVLAYFTGAWLAWKAFGSAMGPAFFYPSAGVTLAAMTLTRRSRWPAVAAAIVIAETMVDLNFGNPPQVAAGYALANVVEPIIGASALLAWCGGTPDLRQRRDLAGFLAGACMLGPAFGGLIGGTVSNLSTAGSTWVIEVLHWWAGDALGVLVIGAPILLWRTQLAVLRSRPGETATVLALAIVVSVTAFWTEAPPSSLILPLLAWAALRLDMVGAALTGAITAFIGASMVSQGRGVFAGTDLSPPSQLALTQLFIGVLVTVALLIAQEASARVRAVREQQIERRERLRLEGLSQLAQQLSAALTPDDIGRALESHVLNEAGGKALNLGLVTTERRRMEWVSMVGYPAEVFEVFGPGVALSDRLVATDTVNTSRPVLIRTQQDYQERYGEGVQWMRRSGAESIASWPLESGGPPFGALVVMWEQQQTFDASQLAYISTVATMVSQALVRARIYADEHARAAVLQSAIMPETVEATPGAEVGVTYEPADATQGLGGDWYDVMSLPGDKIYLAVGDVLGHGLAAVEDMAQMRSAARALAFQGLPPSQLLAELNGFVRSTSHSPFATMAVAIFDPANAVAVYGTAGHPPPLLRRAQTAEVIRLTDTAGPVLGPLARAAYSEGAVSICPADVLVLYTDGLVERRGLDIDTGMTRAQRIIAGWRGHTALAPLCEALVADLAPRPRTDDVCILAVRFTD